MVDDSRARQNVKFTGHGMEDNRRSDCFSRVPLAAHEFGQRPGHRRGLTVASEALRCGAHRLSLARLAAPRSLGSSVQPQFCELPQARVIQGAVFRDSRGVSCSARRSSQEGIAIRNVDRVGTSCGANFCSGSDLFPCGPAERRKGMRIVDVGKFTTERLLPCREISYEDDEFGGVFRT